MQRIKNKNPIIFILLLGLLALNPFFLAAGGKPEAGRALKIAVLPDVDSIPFMIAEMKGFFAEEGAPVELLLFKSPVDRDSAFQAGAVDGAVSDILAAAFAVNGGFDIRITSLTNGSYKLLAAPSFPIGTIAGFRGKGIAMSLNTIIEYSTDRMLTDAGLSSRDIEKVVIPQMPLRLEMLSSGKVHGATLPEPLATQAILDGARLIESSDRMGINPGVLLFSQKALAEKEESIRRFYRAYNRAAEYLQTAPREEYIDELIRRMGFPPAVRDAMELPAYHPAAAPPEREIREVMEWLLERNLIGRNFSYGEIVRDDLLPR